MAPRPDWKASGHRDKTAFLAATRSSIMAFMNVHTAVQALSISSALVGAGAIAALSAFDIPEIQSQPADRALPMIRWLFSRGSHIFPQAAILSASGFGYLAYKSIPEITIKTLGRSGYVAAAVLAFSIAPFTSIVMIPNNFALIEENEKLGGTRSQASAKLDSSGNLSARESVAGKGQAPQFTDLSGPQTKTKQDSTAQQNQEVHDRLTVFQRQNAVRALLLGAGGVVGLLTALA